MVVYGFAKKNFATNFFACKEAIFFVKTNTTHELYWRSACCPLFEWNEHIFSGNVSMSFGSWKASFHTVAIVGFHYHALCVTFIMKWGPDILPKTHLLLLFLKCGWLNFKESRSLGKETWDTSIALLDPEFEEDQSKVILLTCKCLFLHKWKRGL